MEQKHIVAKKIAQELLKIKAVILRPEQPFTWASGLKSPIYCDNRKTLSYPDTRTYIKDKFVEVIKELYPNVEVIAGVATGAIAQGALIAEQLNLPFVYVRSESKSHGLENQVEGVIHAGQKVIVIEDLISTGGSSLKAVAALRKTGAEVIALVSIFSYGFAKALDNFANQNCKFETLSDYDHLVETALESGYINKDSVETLVKWRENPEVWK